MVGGSIASRERVVIVDHDMDFGLKVADHLASSGYHAVLGRSLDALLDDLSEMRPGAIVLSEDPLAVGTGLTRTDVLQAVKALCPQAPVITICKPKDGSVGVRATSVGHSTDRWTDSSNLSGVEEILRAKLGIPCARIL